MSGMWCFRGKDKDSIRVTCYFELRFFCSSQLALKSRYHWCEIFVYRDNWCWLTKVEKSMVIKKGPVSLKWNLENVSWEVTYRNCVPELTKARVGNQMWWCKGHPLILVLKVWRDDKNNWGLALWESSSGHWRRCIFISGWRPRIKWIVQWNWSLTPKRETRRSYW